MRIANTRLFDGVELAVDQASAVFGMEYMEHWGLVAQWTNTTPTGKNFGVGDVFPATDQLYIAAHAFASEMLLQLTTTGTLPAGLATGTDYYVIVVDANYISLATTRALAKVGTAVDITDSGTGTHTATAKAISITLDVEYAATKVPVEADWISSGKTLVMDDDPLIGQLSDSNVGFRNIRLSTTATGGSGLLTVDINAKATG